MIKATNVFYPRKETLSVFSKALCEKSGLQVPKSFKEYFNNFGLFGDSIINFEYILINVNKYTNEALQSVGSLIGSVFALDKKQTDESFIINLTKAAEVFISLTADEQIDFMYWLKDVLTQKAGFDKKNFVEEMLKNLENEIGER